MSTAERRLRPTRRNIRPRPGESPLATAGAVAVAEPPARPRERVGGPSLEIALHALIVVVAVAVRFWELERVPLSPAESASALASWHLYRGEPASLDQGPLLAYGNALFILLFGASDASVRALPALFGTAIVALPYFARHQLGRLGAIVAAALLAVSPSLVFLSRSVSAEAIVATLSLTAAVAAFQYGRTHRPGFLYAAAVSFALLLNVGPSAYTVIVAFAVFAAWSTYSSQERFLPPSALGRKAVLLAGLVFLLTATAGLSNLRGLPEGAIGGLSRWLTSFAPTSEGLRPGYYGQVLLAYEGLLVVFGVAAIIYWATRSRPFGGRPFLWLAICWAAIGFVLVSLMGEKSPGFVVLPVVPLALLVGALAEKLFEGLRGRVVWRNFGLFMGAMTVPLLLVIFLVSHMSRPDPRVSWNLASIPGLAALAILGIAWWWLGRGETARLLVRFLFLVLVALFLSSMVRANIHRQEASAEVLAPSASVADVRALVRDIAEVADMRAMSRQDRALTVDDSYVYPLAWYLREQEQTSFASVVADGSALVVLDAEAKAPTGSYVGQRYSVRSAWPASGMSWAGWWRWLIFRQLPTALDTDDVILYVRS